MIGGTTKREMRWKREKLSLLVAALLGIEPQ